MSRGGPPARPSRELLVDAALDPDLEWVDSHCHMQRADANEVLADARAAGVVGMVVVGTDASTSAEAVEVVAGQAGLVATVGVHPHDASTGVDGILPLLGAPGVVAVGECGLDYHYEHSPRAAQRAVFAAQIALAHQHDLALVIHTREAWDETFEILDAEGVPDRAVLHCFTGGPDEARAGLDRGLHLSFSGIVSFPSAEGVRAAAALCPSDRLLVETDAPYLAPVPHRGRTNLPGLLPFVGAAVATARGEAVASVAAAAGANARRLFPGL